MNAASPEVKVFTCSSSATVAPECAGHVVVSGSYGGEYNAYHAAKWGIRGVVLSDAGVGKHGAGIKGLAYLDRIGLPAATADGNTCHIADGDHILAHGVISYVNEAAQRIGVTVGQTVQQCVERMRGAPVVTQEPPTIGGGKRFVISEAPNQPKVICLDAAPMLEASDAGAIAITGSHAALFRGKPDNVIGPDLAGVFFSDGGVGKDQAGIKRLADLDLRNIPAGTASADSAAIGDSRDIYENGVLSFVNESAKQLGARPGMTVKAFVDTLLEIARRA
jgi:uncharacterized protein YunC (DUF1805 family)